MNRSTLIYLIVSMLLLVSPVILHASGDSLNNPGLHAGDSVGEQLKGVVVKPFTIPIFRIYAGIGPFNAEERARAVEEKIKKIAVDPFYRSDSVCLMDGEGTIDVMYGESVITTISEADAIAEGSSRELVAEARRTKIIYAIQHHRSVTSVAEILKNAGITIGIILFLIFLITLINRLFRLFSVKMEVWQDRIMKRMHLKDYEFFNRQRQLVMLRFLVRISKWFLVLFLLIIALLTIFYLLPWTKALSAAIVGFVIAPLKNMAVNFWGYLPKLITILVIVFVARLIIRLFKFLKTEVEKGTLKVPGFYSDWASPTFNILRVLVIAFTLVACWPYLPGSDSHVFQGISVFFGLVFSLTSASALSNFMAGLTITYTRSFKLGDRVMIGEVLGDIVEKSMLVTKIRTIKNEEVTVPNNKIMNSEVINYSRYSGAPGLIIHTTITIGYDAPWRQVHQLLIEAALNTDLILKNPVPFVMQTALNDFYVSYQVNAYTRSPNKFALILANLHEHIQDSFNHAGVEIMSPHFNSIRDGNTIAIPEEFRAKGYAPSGFRVEKTD